MVNQEKLKRVNYYIASIVIITMIPAGYMTWQIIKQSVIENNVESFLRNEIKDKGTYILSHTFDKENKTLAVVTIGNSISNSNVKKAQEALSDYQLADYRLRIIQGANTALTRKYVLAVVKTSKTLPANDKQQLYKWLKVRIKTDHLQLVVLPQ